MSAYDPTTWLEEENRELRDQIQDIYGQVWVSAQRIRNSLSLNAQNFRFLVIDELSKLEAAIVKAPRKDTSSAAPASSRPVKLSIVDDSENI